MNKKLILLPIVAMMLVGCGSKKKDPEPTPEPTPTPEVENTVKKAYEAAKALEDKAESAEAYTFKGTIVAINGRSFSVQDRGYAMYVYNYAAIDDTFAVGKEVEVNATLQNYSGTFETKTINSAVIKGDGQMPAAVQVTTKAELDALNQNVLVSVAKWTSSAAITGYSSSSSKNIKGNVGAETGEDLYVTASFDKFGFSEDKGAIVNSVLAGDALSLANCVVLQYKGALQFGVWGSSTVAKLA